MGDADVEGVGGYGSREHSGQHGAAAPSQHQPESADEFGSKTIAKRHVKFLLICLDRMKF
jgi:hypothetical protein